MHMPAAGRRDREMDRAPRIDGAAPAGWQKYSVEHGLFTQWRDDKSGG